MDRFVAGTALLLAALGATARAGNLSRGGISGGQSSSAPSATSQTATAATTATAQAAQSAVLAQRATISMQRSILALQTIQAQVNAQSAARNLSLSGPAGVNGLAAGGLVPQGGLTAPTAPAIDNIQLNTTGSSVTVANGGTVTLPTGTTGSDQIALSGNSGNITTTGGTITVKSGTVTTTSGGTLTSTAAGTITTTAGGDTITTPSGTTFTSTSAGSYTMPGDTTPTTFAANSPVTVIAGSTITLSGAGTVTTSGASTLTLAGAGSLSGGTVTTGNGTTGFTGSALASLTAGSTVNLTGSGTVSLANGTSGALSLILPAATNFSTAGAVVSNPTTSYTLPASWTGVGSFSQSVAPTASNTPSDYVVTVQQTAQQALLYWQTFNIGKNTTLDFDQSLGGADVGNWVAINKVAANIAPSQILGVMEAPGQVYVINQNGIIFGGSSQINMGALVASSLPINDNLVSRGLLNNPDLQFLFSQINIPAGTAGPTPAFTPATAPTSGTISQVDSSGNVTQPTATGQDGDVVVEAGAQLSSPTTPEHVGGRIALIGPNVNNSGTISTPDGQTILAAGLQVGLQAHPSNDPSLRGLDVAVGEVSDPGYDNGATVSGTATNDGLIEIPRADLTIAGEFVNQNAVVDSSTSVTLNGRIDLLANYDSIPLVNSTTFSKQSNFYPTASGVVTLGANSLTEILPDGEITYGANGAVTYTPPSELPDTDTVVGSQLALSSLVDIQAGTIYMGTDSMLLAPSAALPSNSSQPALAVNGVTQAPAQSGGATSTPTAGVLTAGVTLSAGNWLLQTADGSYALTYTNGQVYLDSGATIDVSGSENVSASVAENIIAVQLRGTELANSPLQQNGALRGLTVDVNIMDTGNYQGTEWVGTPIGDVSGYVNLIQHTVGELTTAGGTVAINAGGSTVLQPGSAVDVSGGWINYQGATVQTTKVVSNGLVYDISQATPDLVYSGIYTGFTTTSSKWGVTQNYSNSIQTGPVYEAGYIQGGNGGGISITTPTLALDGSLLGNTVAGSYQRTTAAQVATTFSGTTVLPTMLDILAMPASSALSLTFQAQNPNDPAFAPDSPTPPNVVFEANGNQPAVGAFGSTLPAQRELQVDLSPDLLTADGFGALSIVDSGGINSVAVTTSPTVAVASSSLGSSTVTLASSTLPSGFGVGSVLLGSTVVGISGTTVTLADDADATASNATETFSSSGTIIVPSGVSLTTPYGGSALPGGTGIAGGAFEFNQVNGLSVLNEKLTGGGSVAFGAANIDIEGNVTVPGGNISLIARTFSPDATALTTPAPDTTRGTVTIGANATLSTAGLVVDDRQTSFAAGTAPVLTKGGSVTIKGFNVDLVSGTQARDAINVSGGVDVNAAGKISYGNGGSVDIEAGIDPAVNGASLNILGGQLVWNPNVAQVTAFSGGTGGSLTVKAPLIQIGGSTLQNGDTVASGNTLWLNQTDASGNLLEPDFFSQGGFTGFTLDAIGEANPDPSGNSYGQYLPGTLIAPNTTIAPVTQNWIATLSGDTVMLTTEGFPQGQRAPVSLAFNNPNIKDAFLSTLTVRGAFVMDAGSVIQTDPQTNSGLGLSINAGTTSPGTVTILGKIVIPGGTIAITGAANSNFLFSSTDAAPTIDLGPNSELSTAGAVNLIPNALGYSTGTVLSGGTITLDGNIVAEAGSKIDVSGASGVLDVPPDEAGFTARNLGATSVLQATQVDSNGGTINLIGEQELFTDATLLGAPGGASAQGGALNVSSGIYLVNQAQTPQNPTLTVYQNSLTIPAPSYYGAGQTPIGNAVVDGSGNVIAQRGYFSANSFMSGGFSALTLGGTVQFSGSTALASGTPQTLTITANQSISAGVGGVIIADSGLTVNLNAPYVDLGTPFQSPLSTATPQTNIFSSDGGAYYFSPTYGTGVLNVTASLIDIGNLSLQNIGNVYFTAADGDIRGDGTLDVSGTINLTAGQIYPTTENVFTIVAYDYNGLSGNGTVTIAGSGTRQLPLSAGGELDIYASNITQGGVLRAPIGTINLGSGVTGATPVDHITGSGLPGVTATDTISATQNLTLSAGSVTSVSAVDPTTGLALDIPYGTNSNGVTWIDPGGNDITAGNGSNKVPSKSINISSVNVTDQPNANIDISGGGDLYSYSFVTGTGGTNDILGSSNSFAIIPGYQAAYAPFYSSTDYTNSSLAVGEQVYLNGSNGLPAGTYTLLPARYALEPGAFLITPQTSATPPSSIGEANGTTLVSGYEFNGFNTARTAQPLLTSFLIDSPSDVSARASYDVLSANAFLGQSALSAGKPEPRLPIDAGQLVLAATQNLNIAGSVTSQPQAGGLGGLVDIATTSNIIISGPNTNVAADESGLTGSTLVLDSSDLSAFGADSLLIGGFRQTTTGGDSVTVTTNSLTVDNAGAFVTVNGQTLNGLSAPDVVLVSNQDLTLAPDAEIVQSATTSTPSNLFFSGDGTFLRVSSSSSVQTVRTGVNPLDTVPSLVVGAGATISGTKGASAGSVTLDSTYATTFDPTAVLTATTVNLDSGQISLELTPPATAPTTAGLILSGPALSNLQASAKELSLLSYSSIDIYGSGTIGAPESAGVFPVSNLALHAAEIRGFSDSGGGGTVTINAQDISFDNSPNGTAPGAVAASSGSLTINAATIELGSNQLNLDQYSSVVMNASSSVMLDPESKVIQADTSVVTGTGGLTVSNGLTINTPLITASAFSSTQAPGNETITASGGDLTINPLGTTTPTITEGLGATLVLVGQNVIANSAVSLPGGSLTLHATAGDVSAGGSLSVAGTAQIFNDVTKYTSAGQITLTSDTGSVNLAANSSSSATVDVSANSGGGNAGSFTVNAPTGTFTFAAGTVAGQAGAGGQGGTFSADVATLNGSSSLSNGVTNTNVGNDLTPLETLLNTGGFTQSQSIRVRGGTVQGVAYNDVYVDGTTAAAQVNTANFTLSADTGSIIVTGTINASDVAATDSLGNPIQVGGTIDLTASGSVTLTSGSVLTVAAQNFDNAGKGGSVTLSAGAETNGNFNNVALGSGPMVDIQSGSTIDLSVAANNGSADGGNSAAMGHLTGTLVLTAPQTTGNTDLQVAPINGNIVNASSIAVVGNQVFNASSDGSIDNQEGNVLSNGTTFTGNTASILTRLYQNNANGPALQALTRIEPGAEIINTNLDTAANPTAGDLTLANNWDLSAYHFNGVPGVLTLRAGGNVVLDFGASLSDGFNASSSMWQAPMLSAGSQSWSYQIVAGADFSGANFADVQSAATLQAAGFGGSVIVGEGVPGLPSTTTGHRSSVLSPVSQGGLGYFQTIRTGTGNITIDAGGDVQLLNNLATIYTAGTQAAAMTGFTTPTFGTIPQPPNYGPQYSLDGGNVAISAQGNIAHETASGGEDSSLELPTTWLYRQGAVNSAGQFLNTTGRQGKMESTSWWVDFSNFFEGVGALGGGNVTLTAGGSVNNVDAVIPTNERTTLLTTASSLAANQTELELGGGDLTVNAGDNINGGVYYVERGQGAISAGNQILTNITRAAVTVGSDASQSINWLPTTLFLGQGSFNVTAGSDLLLGAVANPFYLPQGTNNTFVNESYFSTYASKDAVNVSSLDGSLTLKDSAEGGTGSLANWYTNVYLAPNGTSVATASEPWLESVETSFTPFATVAALLPPTLNAVAFSSDIDVIGTLTLTPSPTGTVDLVAAGSLNGFQVNILQTFDGSVIDQWSSSVINLSDANPANIPGVLSPLSSALPTTNDVLTNVDALFAESGSTEGLNLQTKEALHADINNNVLHANDPNPVHLLAGTGDISGFTLFSGKAAQVVAGQDLTDIALYIQNDNATDVSVVAAGRDITAYDPSSSLRSIALDSGSILDNANNGDIQISGPGTLEVLAGRDLNLGTGSNNANGSEDIGGTEAGLSSIGNTRDPNLPFGGANIIAAASIGSSAGLDQSQLNFGNVSVVNGNVTPNDPVTFATTFIGQFLSPAVGAAESTRYLPDLATLMSLPSTDTDAQIWNAFGQLSAKQQDVYALDIFYLALRDSGRDHNSGSGTGYGTGYAAINALFPGAVANGSSADTWAHQGDVNVGTREIKTTNGGDINILVPGGQLTVGSILTSQPVDQGILTEDGGNISIYTSSNVNVGTSRVFTLHGGNEIIWSTNGDIAAGNSSKTVQSAPPTRVIVDPQSGGVQTDLAGLATGGGIGVLETVVGAPPSDVDLIAPNGTVNAGDAGIRVSGNLNIAAAQVLNAGNIQVGGKSGGVPATSAPNVAGLSAASSVAGSATSAADQTTSQNRNQLAQQQQADLPSIITIEVLGYGGGSDD